MNYLNYNNIEELKQENFKKIKKEIQETLGRRVDVRVRSWDELWELILVLKKITFKEVDESQYQSIYFRSDESRIIYALVELDTGYRAKELGITRLHYLDREKAKQWYRDIAKIIHPDICSHPNASSAIDILNNLYKNMKG